MMARTLLLLLLAAALSTLTRASDPIPGEPTVGNSATVRQPHVTAELIPDFGYADKLNVVLHLHADPGWHTYWVNPGESGLATHITWTLPEGFTAGPIQWPPPETHMMGPITTYGYEGDVYLLTTITLPQARDKWPLDVEIKAHVTWLVCEVECIPGRADLSFRYEAGMTREARAEDKLRAKFFDAVRDRLPVPNTRWDIKADYGLSQDSRVDPKVSLLTLVLQEKQAEKFPMGHLTFFPEQSNVLGVNPGGVEQLSIDAHGKFHDNSGPTFLVFPEEKKPASATTFLAIGLAQNGEKPDKLSGVLVSDLPLIGNAKAIYISEFPVKSAVAAASGVPVPSGGSASPSSDNTAAPAQGPAPATTTPADAYSGGLPVTPSSGGPAMTGEPVLSGSPQATGGSQPTVARRSTATTENQPFLLVVLAGAFVGGLILNLMPCVLPVLSLKVFSLIKHAGDNKSTVWFQGVAFTAGVVISFWVLAGLLIALKTAGNHLGWAFQMQNAYFVLALILIFFLLALNLFGVYELGTSFVGLDARTSNKLHGTTSSFLNGVLATLAATPCTAAFSGTAIGFAAQQPPFVAMLVFTFLALGLAAPYLLLTIFPAALKFVPKPGAWMEAFKQFMGFLLMGSVIWFINGFIPLVGQSQIPFLLSVLVLAALAAWIYGRWAAPTRSSGVRLAGITLAALLLAAAIGWGVVIAKTVPSKDMVMEDGWQPWTPAAVDAALAQGRPVFVDFTAAWCANCKVNEFLALGNDAVKKAFVDKNVALFRADWTRPNDDIANTLQKYNRDGVPLYLLYSPKDKETPQVLPDGLISPNDVLEALKNL